MISKGVEFEFRFRATDALTLTGGLGVTDAYYDQYRFSEGQDFSGNDIPLTPKYDASLALQYDITDRVYANVHVNALGSSVLNVNNTAKQSSYRVVSTRVGYNMMIGRLKCTLRT